MVTSKDGNTTHAAGDDSGPRMERLALFQGPRWMADSNRYWFEQAGITLPKDLRDIPDEMLSQVCDGVGLFGPPEYCAERLARAREESGVDHVCLFTAHLEGLAGLALEPFDFDCEDFDAGHLHLAGRIGE